MPCSLSHSWGIQKRGVHGLSPQLKTPPEHNPGSLELEGRGQVCSVGSYLTLLNKVNNCTALLLRRWQEKESWRLWTLHAFSCCSDKTGPQPASCSLWHGKSWGCTNGMVCSHFCCILTGKADRSDVILHRAQLLWGNKEGEVLGRFPWEITCGAEILRQRFYQVPWLYWMALW